HLDHMEGFYRERAIFDQMEVEQVWMSLPSHPDYYDNYKNARRQKKVRDAVARFSNTMHRRGIAMHPAFDSLIQNNLANKDRIDYLRKLGKKPVAYLARGNKAAGATRWSQNIRVRVLAPEEDTSVYYSRNAASRANGAALAAFTGVSPAVPSDDAFQ